VAFSAGGDGGRRAVWVRIANAKSFGWSPNQMRAFESYVSLYDMPEPKKWGWTYTVQELRER
jgi:hypothetical protein